MIRRAVLLPEEVGALVGETICEKSPSEATVTMGGSVLPHSVLAVADICKTALGSWRGFL